MDSNPLRKKQQRKRIQDLLRILTSEPHTCHSTSIPRTQQTIFSTPRPTPAPQPAPHAVQTLELVTPSIQHGSSVELPLTAHTVTGSSNLFSQLREEINTLKEEVRLLKEEIARMKAAPRPRQSQHKIWHQDANNIVGAMDSRSAPTHSYDCVFAHGPDGRCTWRNKKVTLQAYVLHLKRKHRLNVSDNPEMRLLPVLSST